LASSIRSLIASTTCGLLRAQGAVAVRTRRAWRAGGRGFRDPNFKNLQRINRQTRPAHASPARTTEATRGGTGDGTGGGAGGSFPGFPGWPFSLDHGRTTARPPPSARVRHRLAGHTFLRTSASCRRASNMVCVREKFEFVTRRRDELGRWERTKERNRE
jgi:hypothetical protein